MQSYDVVVIGLGAMGSAALHHAARRGVRVLGVDRFGPGHDRGSSHGVTRVIRLGYFEHPSYVPLLRRAYHLWRDLEAESGQALLTVTGIAEIGPANGMLVPATLASARLHDLVHEIIDARALMKRIPAFRVPDDYVAVLQPDGGFLAAEAAVAAQHALAQSHGADIRTGTTIRAIEPRDGHVRIVTADAVIEAGVAIVAAGAWTPTLLADFALPLHATRQVQAWFEPADPGPVGLGSLPVFLLESRHGVHYGFPQRDARGVKVAKHHHAQEIVDPERYDRGVSARDEALIRAAIADHLPAADGPMRSAQTCLYTMTPDGDFLIDHAPGASNVIIASPCSGHGFKFAPVIGEILADLAIDGATRHDISRFRLGRF